MTRTFITQHAGTSKIILWFFLVITQALTMHTGKGSKAVRQREQLILALLQQPSLERAAALIGISTVTAWRISKTREFKEEYRSARWEAFSQSLARLQQASGAAVSALLKVMVDKTTPAASRVRAADRVLDHAARGTEMEDLEARLAELERAVNPSKSEDSKPA